MSTLVITEVDEKTGRILRGYTTWKTGNVVHADPLDLPIDWPTEKERRVEEFRKDLLDYVRKVNIANG